MATWPAKTDYATGDVLSATNMNDIGNGLNDLYGESFTNNFYAGKNAIINGGMDFWQRGTSTSGNGYTCVDRFYVYGSGSSTFSRESTIVPTGAQYSFKHLAGATTSSSLAQVIETANAVRFAGQNATLTYQASASTATTMAIGLAYSTTVDNGIGGSWTAITPTSGATFAAGTGGAFTTGTAVFAVPSTAKSLRVTLSVSGTIANTVAVYYGNAQLELGSTATPFSRAGGTIQGELAACQRYYYRIASAFGAYEILGIGSARSTTAADCYIKFPVTMRTAPTSLDFANVGYFAGNITTAINAGSGLLLDTANMGTQGGLVYGTVASGLTTNQITYLAGNNNSAAYIGFSAEL